MSYPFARLVAGFLLICAVAAQAAAPSKANAPAAPAQQSDARTELQSAQEAASSAQIAGPSNITVRDQAHLQLPKGYSWIPDPAATQLMESMGNQVDDSFLGLVFPADGGDWFVSVTFVKEGYIKEDDAKDWNADDLLDSLKKGTEAGNEERIKHGVSAIEVVGWAQKPTYDAAMHRLVWSALSREKSSGAASDEQGVNYNTYALGREGYISLNLITNAKDLDQYKPEALKLLGALQFDDGKRYADFKESTDKVAAYGLAALVAGAAAKKLGLLALILAFAAKFIKVFLVGAAAAVWGASRIFRKKDKTPVAAESGADGHDPAQVQALTKTTTTTEPPKS